MGGYFLQNSFAKKSSSKWGLFKSSLWLMAGFTVLLFVFSAFLRITLQKMAIQRQIDELKRDKEKFEANNKDLAGLLDYFASESYKEREMRSKMSLQKPGEQAIIISREKNKPGENISAPETDGSAKLSNFKKWWNYFFGNK